MAMSRQFAGAKSDIADQMVVQMLDMHAPVPWKQAGQGHFDD